MTHPSFHPNPLLVDLPVPIETTRLRLRPPQPGEGAALLEALQETLPELRKFLASLPWVANDHTLETAEIYCRNAHGNFVMRKDLPFFIHDKASGRLVGACGLHRTDWAVPKTEVGYWVRTSQSGKGYVTEAVQALVGFAFDVLNAQRVELVTDEENTASRKVADRCGFALEGTLRNERRAPDGTLRTACIYARFPASAASPGLPASK